MSDCRKAPVSDEIKKAMTPSMARPVKDSGYTPLQAIATVACGCVFGFALHKAGVYKAGVIRDQFRFHDNTMLKVFLSATATSIVGVTIMYGLKATKEQMQAIGNCVYRIDIGLPATAVGAAILGAGMAISGSCPGTVWAQLGAGSVWSVVTLAGGLFGAAAFGLLHQDFIAPRLSYGITAKKWIGDLIGLSQQSTAVVMAGAMAAVVAFLENYSPSAAMFSIRDVNIHPIACGITIGLLQWPLMFLVGKNLGSSSSFVTLAANCVGGLCESAPYLKKFRDGFINWWQVLYVASASLGSFAAYALSTSDKLYDVTSDVTIGQSLLGGFLIVFGARIANGCTSGHGISGMGHLATRSLLAVAAMFAGGIATTALFF